MKRNKRETSVIITMLRNRIACNKYAFVNTNKSVEGGKIVMKKSYAEILELVNELDKRNDKLIELMSVPK